MDTPYWNPCPPYTSEYEKRPIYLIVMWWTHYDGDWPKLVKKTAGNKLSHQWSLLHFQWNILLHSHKANKMLVIIYYQPNFKFGCKSLQGPLTLEALRYSMTRHWMNSSHALKSHFTSISICLLAEWKLVLYHCHYSSSEWRRWRRNS